MNQIPREFINDLLTRCDLVEIIDARIPLKKKGGNYSACCPFHNEKTPSFTVSPVKQFYHCFGCGVSGNAIGFLMEYERLSFVEAIEQLAQHLNIPIPQSTKNSTSAVSSDLYNLMEQVARYYQHQLRGYPHAIEYLKKRGLSGKIAKEFGIGYVSAAWDNLLKKFANHAEVTQQLLAAGLIIKKDNNFYDRFRDRIMFPIRDRRGRVIAFGGRILNKGEPKYLNSPETIIFHKGSELYGLYEATKITREPESILVVEGYMDVVALAQHGITNVVATLGTATSTDHVQRLMRVTQKIIFCFDGDRAGKTAAWRALEVALPLLQDGFPIQFLLLPPGEDPDSLVRTLGEHEFLRLVQQASSLADFLFNTLNQQVDLGAMEGKAKFAKLAADLLNKIPAGVYQHMLFERLAQLVRMDVATLKNITHKTIVFSKANTPQKNIPTLQRSPMRVAIALLLQQPQLAQSITEREAVLSLSIPGSDIFKRLLTLLQEFPNLNTAALLEYWRDSAEKIPLEKLAGMEINVPLDGLEGEFLGTLEKLLFLDCEWQIEQLMQKANLTVLEDEEKIQLQKLIALTKCSSFS